MLSSNRLFLLFLVLVALLVLLLLKPVRGYVTRAVNLTARASGEPLAWAPRPLQAPPASHEELPHTTMSETLIPRRDENDRWKALIRESRSAVGQYLVPAIDMNFASFVRCITLRVFLVVFLGVDPDTLAFQNLQLVTGELSDVYDDKQGKRTLSLGVQNILYEWLPREQFPASLDRILPAYEALWRIIATIVVTCEDDETRALRWVMLDFRDNPRDEQYGASLGGEGRSVSVIMDGVVGRIAPIARPPHAATSTWPLGCIQYASASGSIAEPPPTIQEALKFAALLASVVIGQIGVHYGISGGSTADSQASPWDRRSIHGVNRSPGHLTINVEARMHANASKQGH